LQVIIKTTNNCNLHCKYCYHRHFCRLNNERLDWSLSLDELELIFRRLREWHDEDGMSDFRFIWHGGEPLTLPREYYESMLRMQERMFKGVKCENSLQSNLCIPLDDRYISFLVKNNFNVGMSYDVINTARDPARKHRAQLMRNFFRFDRHGYRPGAIVVITPHSVDYPEILYDFFKAHEISGRFNLPDVYTPEHRKYHVGARRYFEFMKEMFELWKADGFKGGRIGNLVDMAMRLKYPDRNSMCIYDKTCAYGRIHIAINGDVYPCDGLADQRELIYGNIFDQNFTLKSLFKNPVIDIFEERGRSIRRLCSRCRFYKNCYGGCLNDSIRSTGSFFERTDECSYLKKMFALLEPHVDKIVKECGGWRRRKA